MPILLCFESFQEVQCEGRASNVLLVAVAFYVFHYRSHPKGSQKEEETVFHQQVIEIWCHSKQHSLKSMAPLPRVFAKPFVCTCFCMVHKENNNDSQV